MPQIESWKLEPGWVFRSDRLARGYPLRDTAGRPVIVIDPDRAVAAAHDPTRSQALYAVEEKECSSCDHTYECCIFIDITARRLAADGSLDPNGERIRLCLTTRDTDTVATVELVGYMNASGTALGGTLSRSP